MTDPLLEARHIRKVFGSRTRGDPDVVAVSGVSFEVFTGEALAVVGESGSGKTTVARMLVGLEAPTEGTIVIAGRDCSRPARGSNERRRRAREIQMVFQDPYISLDPHQTVRACIEEVLTFHGHGRGRDLGHEVESLLQNVGLDPRRANLLPRRLSGGERQRVAIARALAARPRILVLDEAVSALDVSIQAQVLRLLADIRETSDICYIFISHDLAVVRQISDRMIVMQRGLVVERGETHEVLDRPRHEYTKLLRDSVPGPGWRQS